MMRSAKNKEMVSSFRRTLILGSELEVLGSQAVLDQDGLASSFQRAREGLIDWVNYVKNKKCKHQTLSLEISMV